MMHNSLQNPMIKNAKSIQSIMKSRTQNCMLEVHRQWPKSAFQRFYWINIGNKKQEKYDYLLFMESLKAGECLLLQACLFNVTSLITYVDGRQTFMTQTDIIFDSFLFNKSQKYHFVYIKLRLDVINSSCMNNMKYIFSIFSERMKTNIKNGIQ